MAFFPQEDDGRLTILRENLTPFLKVVARALSYELENGTDTTHSEKSDLLNEILENLPTENSTSNFFVKRSQAFDTLHLEFVQLLNIR